LTLSVFLSGLRIGNVRKLIDKFEEDRGEDGDEDELGDGVSCCSSVSKISKNCVQDELAGSMLFTEFITSSESLQPNGFWLDLTAESSE